MPIFIDRRLNPKDRSLSNRQRFLKRVHDDLKRSIGEQVKEGRICDVDASHSVPVPKRGADEPKFRNSAASGERHYILPGNHSFSAGDRIAKRPGGGQGADRAAGRGEDEDDFLFVLSRDEVLDLFFEDLELPDMVKLSLRETVTYKPHRAGFATSGTPSHINVARTLGNSLGRRIALRRPSEKEYQAIANEVTALEAEPRLSPPHRRRLTALRVELEVLERRRKRIAFLDPVDVRFNRFERLPLHNANAVMFCLMDVSASMGEREKDLAKRFFVLLHLFLKRRYDRINVVFIRHTDEAREVDEETFFFSKQSGGTVVSSALEEMQRIILDRYPSSTWNIYVAQASDGDNATGDSERCARLLRNELMKLIQYYAYVEIIDERESEIFGTTDNGTALWRAYRTVNGAVASFQMTRIAKPADIYPVFRKLFVKQTSASGQQLKG
ncbi:YeaH/YhbH family protein [Neorhizobium sp. T786]|uniref:YeaH/YhbH family protein n=1 Tax=Pseudorhizobium xiangyangii TaxID=2883104 RepID=UPI001CFF6568|nr:YeaH/YhbH family protein [Neorhizobium xiangyangii]MCB5203762.1 YeaH/YhbH family protein [Neorhizobium xiangyangii]